jgi:predicted nucleic acid-binding protein
MRDRAFLDTNVLLYAYSEEEIKRESAKKQKRT